jgi:hypothetical protein
VVLCNNPGVDPSRYATVCTAIYRGTSTPALIKQFGDTYGSKRKVQLEDFTNSELKQGNSTAQKKTKEACVSVPISKG